MSHGRLAPAGGVRLTEPPAWPRWPCHKSTGRARIHPSPMPRPDVDQRAAVPPHRQPARLSVGHSLCGVRADGGIQAVRLVRHARKHRHLAPAAQVAAPSFAAEEQGAALVPCPGNARRARRSCRVDAAVQPRRGAWRGLRLRGDAWILYSGRNGVGHEPGEPRRLPRLSISGQNRFVPSFYPAMRMSDFFVPDKLVKRSLAGRFVSTHRPTRRLNRDTAMMMQGWNDHGRAVAFVASRLTLDSAIPRNSERTGTCRIQGSTCSLRSLA
jgi:hypothetical protein